MCGVTDLRAYLRSLDVKTLAELLTEQAERDPELRERLLRRAGEPGGELAEVRDLLDGPATARAGASQEGFDEAAKIGAVLDTLQRLLDSGTRADLAPLARRAVDRITGAARRRENPSGPVGAELRRAVRLYARACAAHPPRPEELAQWIIDREFDGPGRPETDLAEFASALGEDGLGKIKSTVDEVLAEAGPDEARRRTAERLAEQLAEISGDVDALLEILSRRLPRQEVNLKIVRVLRAAGRTTEAVAYAARALNGDSRPVPAPAKTRPEAPARVSAEPEPESPIALLARRAPEDVAAADELVRALLADERPDEAWEAAQRYECSPAVRLELAGRREAEHPADAIAVYRTHIDSLIEQKGAGQYEQAARMLRRVRTLHRKAGTPGEFAEYLAELVAAHKRKVRLLDEIRRARIALPGTRS
ncbi:hypothetical protein FNH05_00195 [Amycolatopsis rhizosphaerae]|uniref:Uncharacterized protein n=1 Tax=Amycolatopsis rhizosphaerae TaxID=2053003 RepID=A0A558DPM5_9PSEU|nr:hypothetical protein [Amycolatopsis rhizosphaerae]TVT62962.1 hypothetical protein FNH05_00195 [Amycolatopsis rhizosphaerae]